MGWAVCVSSQSPTQEVTSDMKFSDTLGAISYVRKGMGPPQHDFFVKFTSPATTWYPYCFVVPQLRLSSYHLYWCKISKSAVGHAILSTHFPGFLIHFISSCITRWHKYTSLHLQLFWSVLPFHSHYLRFLHTFIWKYVRYFRILTIPHSFMLLFLINFLPIIIRTRRLETAKKEQGHSKVDNLIFLVGCFIIHFRDFSLIPLIFSLFQGVLGWSRG